MLLMMELHNRWCLNMFQKVQSRRILNICIRCLTLVLEFEKIDMFRLCKKNACNNLKMRDMFLHSGHPKYQNCCHHLNLQESIQQANEGCYCVTLLCSEWLWQNDRQIEVESMDLQQCFENNLKRKNPKLSLHHN